MSAKHTLVVCEKPDAARRVADALSGGASKGEQVEGTTVFRFNRNGEDYIVCAAQGHVYEVSDPFKERTVYPVFDVEWYPSDLVGEGGDGAARRISVMKKLSAGASKFVNACDFDIEGETIGFNLLRYACGGKEKDALRARFSTLTKEDLLRSFDGLKSNGGSGLARAGRARHAVDFVWGVNFSRALSQSALVSGHRYRTVSIGRVQGPTLRFLVDKEREIREFVPIPYWKVSGVFEKGGRRFRAAYSMDRIETRSQAEQIRAECRGGEAVAASVRVSRAQIGPPAPFNIGDLQKEAYRAFGYPPSRTLQIAERLYLGALISYPRTESQSLPPSIGYRSILRGIGKMAVYAPSVKELMEHELRPAQGAKSDSAHPAIHPTGENPRRPLGSAEAAIYDLVVRRFLATFGPSARRELVSISLVVGKHEFELSGGRTIFPGWMRYYGRYAGYENASLPQISEGDRFMVDDIPVEEDFDQRPFRFNQSSLLEKMEKEGIGTKATRADIIATLLGRGYVSGDRLEVSDLGLAVVETMAMYAPSMISTGLTREVEEKLEAVENRSGREADLLRETVRSIASQMARLVTNEDEVGHQVDSALIRTVSKSFVVGRCPVCKTGELRIVTSGTTKKRFVGCSNYAAGCRASAPLPQRGKVRSTPRPCEHCSWPVVYVISGRRPWKLCVNPSCPGRKKA